MPCKREIARVHADVQSPDVVCLCPDRPELPRSKSPINKCHMVGVPSPAAVLTGTGEKAANIWARSLPPAVSQADGMQTKPQLSVNRKEERNKLA